MKQGDGRPMHTQARPHPCVQMAARLAHLGQPAALQPSQHELHACLIANGQRPAAHTQWPREAALVVRQQQHNCLHAVPAVLNARQYAQTDRENKALHSARAPHRGWTTRWPSNLAPRGNPAAPSALRALCRAASGGLPLFAAQLPAGSPPPTFAAGLTPRQHACVRRPWQGLTSPVVGGLQQRWCSTMDPARARYTHVAVYCMDMSCSPGCTTQPCTVQTSNVNVVNVNKNLCTPFVSDDG